MLVFLDTETTDFRPGQIAQLSYILADGGEITRAENYFFAVESMSPGAERVHGFSEELLRRLSGGRTFADQSDRFLGDILGRTLVAHNVTFDLGFLAAEFSRMGIGYSPSDTFCTMRMSTNICRIPHPNRGGFKWPRLEEALCGLDISTAEVGELAARLFPGDGAGFHDARFDVTGVFLIYQRLME